MEDTASSGINWLKSLRGSAAAKIARPGDLPLPVIEARDADIPDRQDAQGGQLTDELVTRCLRDLTDDWERKGGRLSYDDVTRMTTKRGLNGHQLAGLLDGLVRAKIVVDGLQPTASEVTVEDEIDSAIDAGAPADRDILGTYMKEIGRYPLLYAADEVRLGRLIRTGQEADAALADSVAVSSEPLAVGLRAASEAGRRAHSELVLSNMRLVVSVAKLPRYMFSGLEFIDCIQEGNLGLMRAADKFDYTLGYKFSTYATWWIRQGIERGIADKGRLIRLPVHFHEKLVKVRSAHRRLSNRYDREPTLAEMADAVQMDTGEVQAVLDWLRPTLSTDAPAAKDGDITVGDLLSAEADLDGRTDPLGMVLDAARHRNIETVMSGLLDSRSVEMIKRRYGFGEYEEQTLDEIGKIWGVTRERVRQIILESLDTLSSSDAAHPLYEFLINDTRLAEAMPSAGWALPSKKRRTKK